MQKKLIIGKLANHLHEVCQNDVARADLLLIAKYLVEHTKVKVGRDGFEVEWHGKTDFLDKTVENEEKQNG